MEALAFTSAYRWKGRGTLVLIMKLENQVTSLELSQLLKKLGVKQESYVSWCQVTKDIYEKSHEWELRRKTDLRLIEMFEEEGRAEIVSAFTVAELGEMLPLKRCFIDSQAKSFYFHIEDERGFTIYEEDAWSEADARAKMLIYLLENKLLELETTK